MKKTIFLLFLIAASFVYSQNNTIQIINFSPYTVGFRLTANNPNMMAQDCIPVIFNETQSFLAPGQSTTYGQINATNTVTPAINQWRVYSTLGDNTYNLLAGAAVPAFETSVTSWALIRMYTPAGEELELGRNCTNVGGSFTTPPGYTISATWNTLNGNVLVVIT